MAFTVAFAMVFGVYADAVTASQAMAAAEAWSQVSGASRYTLDVNLNKGILYVTLNSSVARNQLYFQRDILLQKMNEFLDSDPIFVKGEGPAINNIVLN